MGQQLFLQANASDKIVISSNNVGTSTAQESLVALDVVEQQCTSYFQHRGYTQNVRWLPFAGVAVIKPGCDSTGDISVNSSILVGDSAADAVVDSTITLPTTVFGMTSNCTNVGIVVVIYGGIGPLLSGDELLPICVQPTATLVHGRW